MACQVVSRPVLSRPRLLTTVAAAVACICVLGAAAAANAAPNAPARVRVERVARPPRTVVAGSVFRIWDIARNVGPYRVTRTQTLYIAVRGRRLRANAVVLARRTIRAVRPGRSSRGFVK